MTCLPTLRRTVAITVSACLLATQAPAAVALQLRWNELSPVIAGKLVNLTLKGGGWIRGTIREVAPDRIQVDVTKASDRKAYPKGLAAVSRSMLVMIDISKPVGHKGRIIGGVVGAVSALGIVAGGREGGSSKAEIAGAAACSFVLWTGIGWLFDRASHGGGVRITIIPD